MYSLIWIVLVVIGGGLLLFFIAAAAGKLINPQMSGKALFKKQLIQRGLSPSNYPESFHNSVATRAVSVARMLKNLNQEKFSTALTDNVRGVAEVVAMYERGDLNQFEIKDEHVKLLRNFRPIKQKFER